MSTFERRILQYNITAMMVIRIMTPRMGRIIINAKFVDTDGEDDEHFDCNSCRV